MPCSLSVPSLALVATLTASSADSDPALVRDSLRVARSAVVPRHEPSSTRDSVAVTARDSSGAGSSSAPHVAGASRDSLAIPVVPLKPGMQDTVTVIKGITIQDARKPAERTTVTQMRIDRSALVRFQPLTTADALVAAPGVDLVKSGPWSSRVSYRGFQGERVLVLVDGVRLNTGRGHGSNTSLVSVDRLDQVELLAGAQGAEYGSDAMGGVFNLVTHRPLFSEAPSFWLTVSAHGSEPGDEVGQSSRLTYTSNRVGAEMAVGVARLDALVTPDGRVDNSGSHDGDFAGRMAVKLGDQGSFDYEHSRHASRDVGLPALSGSFPTISRDADRAELLMPFKPSVFGRGFATSAHLLAYDQRYLTDFDETNVDTTYSPTRKPIATTTAFARDHITTRSRAALPELRFGKDGALQIGGEIRRETTSGPKQTTTTTRLMSGTVRNVADTTTENVPNARRDVVAISASQGIAVGRLRLEASGRYDWIHSVADSTPTSWSPKNDVMDRHPSYDVGLSYHEKAFEPYGRIATGFRAPNLEERYYRGPVHSGMKLTGDPSLVAETNVTYEAGIRADAGGVWSGRASVYRTYAEDFISLVYKGLDRGQPSFTYQNIDKAQIDGVEVVARAHVRTFTTGLAVTLPRGRNLSNGDPLTEVGTPRVTLDLSAPVPRWIPAGIVSLRARWSDALIAPPLRAEEFGPVSRPAFWTVSAELGTTIGGTRATLSVRNLFDHTYREPLSFIDEPGRTIAFSVKRNFRLPVISSVAGATP